VSAARIFLCLVVVVPAFLLPISGAGAQDRTTAARASVYRVVGVRPGDVLNIRSLPDGSAPIVASLPPGTTGLVRTGRVIQNVDTAWTEIRYNNATGWVAARYLALDNAAAAAAAASPRGTGAWAPEVKSEPEAEQSGPVGSSHVALLIGNGRYPIDSSLSQLTQPPNDVRDLAPALKARGYDVITLVDADVVETRRGLAELKTRGAGAESAFVYFGGHALQMGGESYLLPVGSRIKKAEDLPRHALRLSDLLAAVGKGGPRQTTIVLDASRDNRLHDRLADAAQKAGGHVPGKGLINQKLRPGMSLVFAGQPAETVIDGAGRNSPLALALLAGLRSPDPSMRAVVTGLRDAVTKATESRQVPWYDDVPAESGTAAPATPGGNRLRGLSTTSAR